MKRNCVVCGEEFRARSSRYLACSRPCSVERNKRRSREHKAELKSDPVYVANRNSKRRTAHAARRPMKQCAADGCGKWFKPFGRQRTCSADCAATLKKAQDKSWRREHWSDQKRREQRNAKQRERRATPAHKQRRAYEHQINMSDPRWRENKNSRARKRYAEAMAAHRLCASLGIPIVTPQQMEDFSVT